MNWHRRLAALFLILALSGCVQGVTGHAQTPYPPYPPETSGNNLLVNHPDSCLRPALRRS
jgi:hypothetical protein